MGTKRVGWARIKSLINENQNQLKIRNAQIITITNATQVLTAADSGAQILFAGAAATATLPAVAAGLNFKFFATSAANHIMNGGASVVDGAVWNNSNGTTLARDAFTNANGITLVNGAIGDHWEVECNGTDWLLHGWTNDTPT